MRTVINICARRALTMALAVLALVMALPAQARAEGSAVSTRSVLATFFPKSERVTYKTVVLTSPLKERIAQRLGYIPAADRYTIFVATTGPHVDGYAVVDDEKGEHQPITFATKLSARAVVESVEIVVYREPRGDEVRDPRFRAQFIGKTARDSLRLGHEIDAVSGATISSGAMAVAVRRAAILVDEVMVGRTALATAGAPAAQSPQVAR